jgi:hypothetical protein|nr:MAG TPA: hypothetical protein [Caudoviricetes sp.]
MKVYFLKENTKEYVIYPEPEDKTAYHEIDVSEDVDLNAKRLVEKGGKMVLVDAPENEFYEWDGKAWAIDKAKQTEILAKEKEELILQLADKTDALKAGLLVGYPQTEIDSFYRQEKEALAWQADNKAETPMLKKIAELRGVPFEVLVEKVIEKANILADTIGGIIGIRQKIEDRINAATEQAELDAIKNEVEKWQLQKAN